MTCEKSAYASKRIAESFITKRMRENPTLDLRSYLCKKCGLWHMTHVEDRYARNQDWEEAG